MNLTFFLFIVMTFGWVQAVQETTPQKVPRPEEYYPEPLLQPEQALLLPETSGIVAASAIDSNSTSHKNKKNVREVCHKMRLSSKKDHKE